MAIKIVNFINDEEDLLEPKSNKRKSNKDTQEENLEVVDIKSSYIDKATNLKNDLNSTLNSIALNPVELKFIDLTEENFSTFHYDLLSKDFIGMSVAETTYTFITLSGTVYKTTSKSLANIIIDVPRPIKVTFKNPILNTSMVSMDLLVKILLNKKVSTPQEIIDIFSKQPLPKEQTPEECLYHLCKIYPYFHRFLSTNMYFQYINLEHSVYNISLLANDTLITDLDKVNELIKATEEDIKVFSTKYNINFLQYKSVQALYDGILVHIPSVTTLNKEFLKTLNLTDIYELYLLFVKYLTLLTLKENKGKYNIIDTYDALGQFNNQQIPIPNISGKVLLEASYENLFENILVEVLSDRTFISYVAENDLYTALMQEKGVNLPSYTLELFKILLRATIEGNTTLEEYDLYLQETEFSKFEEADLKSTVAAFKVVFAPIISSINNYNETRYLNDHVPLIVHKDIQPLHRTILNKQRIIFKTLTSDLFEYCNEFNSKNKYKMNIVSLNNSTLYLECDLEALNVSLDVLTRILVENYEKFLKRTKAHCNVINLSN